MSGYYKVDSRKITLREYWNITHSWKALVPWLAARFGAPMQFGGASNQPQTVRELEIPQSEFPPEAKAKLQPVLEQCLELGFHSPRFYMHENVRRDVRVSFISMLHS